MEKKYITSRMFAKLTNRHPWEVRRLIASKTIPVVPDAVVEHYDGVSIDLIEKWKKPNKTGA